LMGRAEEDEQERAKIKHGRTAVRSGFAAGDDGQGGRAARKDD